MWVGLSNPTTSEHHRVVSQDVEVAESTCACTLRPSRLKDCEVSPHGGGWGDVAGSDVWEPHIDFGSCSPHQERTS
eukprot:4489185-Amphidinium_carterae.1